MTTKETTTRCGPDWHEPACTDRTHTVDRGREKHKYHVTVDIELEASNVDKAIEFVESITSNHFVTVHDIDVMDWDKA